MEEELVQGKQNISKKCLQMNCKPLSGSYSSVNYITELQKEKSGNAKITVLLHFSAHPKSGRRVWKLLRDGPCKISRSEIFKHL